jgi:pimeloyl-ACP methyl ester carboxylesterase
MSSIYKSEEGARAIHTRYREILSLWPLPNRQFTVPTRAGETFVIACGPEAAPPVLLFHGSASNSFMWLNDAAALATHFRVYAVDLIGEPGLSARTRYRTATDEHALWLDDVFQALSLESASLVGVSLGGWLALDFAVRRTERVKALVLICPAGIGKLKNFLLKAFPYFFMGEWGRKRLHAMVLGRAYASLSSPAKPVADFLGLIFRNFTPRRDPITPKSDEELRRLKMPIAIYLGGEDALIDSYDTQHRAQALLPQAEIHFDPKIGHFIPTPTAEIVDFLRRANGARDHG